MPLLIGNYIKVFTDLKELWVINMDAKVNAELFKELMRNP